MICSHLVNVSLLLGAILSWGVMWPLIGKQKVNWYSTEASEHSMTSIYGYGYKAFLCIAMLVGDGLYNVKVMTATCLSRHGTFGRATCSAVTAK
ncbi:unnamed protein product [Urochloa humidicola]